MTDDADAMALPASAGADSPVRVLVIDDASLVRLFYRQALEGAGCEVDEAINGIEAMEKVLSRPFDLLIVDVNMPKMDGLAFIRTLRSDCSAPFLPTLVISSEAGEADIEAARSAGANYYLVKPVAQEDLVLYAGVLTGKRL